jgi:hypothetical protein
MKLYQKLFNITLLINICTRNVNNSNLIVRQCVIEDRVFGLKVPQQLQPHILEMPKHHLSFSKNNQNNSNFKIPLLLFF